MGRELKRKQAKRDGKNVREIQRMNKEKPLSPRVFIGIVVILLLFFVTLYLLTGLFITKEIKWFNKNYNDDELIEIENKILAADCLKQIEEEYYVYFYDTKNEDSEVTDTLYSLMDKIYRVDLNDDFNSNFVGEPSGIVENISELKVSNPTIIKVSSEKIVAFYNGADEIKIGLQ